MTRGEGRIQARARGAGERSKVLLDNALCFGCIYAGGAFGNNAPGTETKSVVVGKPASIDVQITGLPSGVDGNVVVVGPGYSSGQLATSKLLKDLDLGDYTMTAVEVKDDSGVTYKPSPLDTSITLHDSDQDTIVVKYKANTGSIKLIVGRLPDFTFGNVVIVGPDYSSGPQLFSGIKTFTDLAAGDYLMTATEVLATSDGRVYEPHPLDTTVTLQGGDQATITVLYKPKQHGLGMLSLKAIGFLGIESGIDADITVSGGPNNVSIAVARDTLIDSLEAGDYTITARNVEGVEGTLYASPPTQTVTIVPSLSVPTYAAVRYGPVHLVLNFGRTGFTDTTSGDWGQDGWLSGRGLVAVGTRGTPTAAAAAAAPTNAPDYFWLGCWPENGLELNNTAYSTSGPPNGTNSQGVSSIVVNELTPAELELKFNLTANGSAPSNNGESEIIAAAFKPYVHKLSLRIDNPGGVQVDIETKWNLTWSTNGDIDSRFETSWGRLKLFYPYPCKGVPLSSFPTFETFVGLQNGQTWVAADTISILTKNHEYMSIHPEFMTFAGGGKTVAGTTTQFSSSFTGTLTFRAIIK